MASMTEATIAFIGGSGLYEMDGLVDVDEVEVETPFGAPSDAVIVGVLDGTRVAFLPRHGRGHRISPTEIPARANVYALKSLGVERIVSISAVGSLKEEVRPLDMVVPDQLIDCTTRRPSTFFDGGIAAHASFADPYCPVLRDVVAQAAFSEGVSTHTRGTCVVIEGPQFSTRAESELYRSWGADLIGMTALPEAKLAREAEICYATMALVTDYDCWHETEEDVSVEVVVANLHQSVATSRQVIREVVSRLPATRECHCASAMRNAIITSPERIPESTRKRLSLLVDKYLSVTREVR